MKYIEIDNKNYQVEDRKYSVQEIIKMTGKSIHKNDLVIRFTGGMRTARSSDNEIIDVKKLGGYDIERFVLLPTDFTDEKNK